MPGDIPASTLDDVIGYEPVRSSHGHPGPTMADGGIGGISDVGGTYVGGTQGVGSENVGC
jgi:hypothetical protein